MRINVSIELRRPARRAVAMVLGLLLLAAPAVVLASHQFTDVPDGHPFHDEISAIAGAGITAGYNDGGYHPGDPVTRQAMAAFMQRGFGRAALAVGTTPMDTTIEVSTDSPSTAPVAVRELTITVPGTTNGFGPTQLVHLQGRIVFYDGMHSSKGCPCWFYAWIRDMTSNTTSVQQSQTFETATTIGAYAYAFDTEALFVAAPGPRSYQLEVALYYRTTPSPDASFFVTSESSLSAMTFPFGPTGGNTASAPGAEIAPDDAQQPERAP